MSPHLRGPHLKKVIVLKFFQLLNKHKQKWGSEGNVDTKVEKVILVRSDRQV